MTKNMIFAKRIRAFRDARGDSQEDLAKLFGYQKQAVSHWEINGKVPRSKVLEVLAERYATSSDYLLGISDDPQSNKHTDQKKPKDLRKVIDDAELQLDGEPLTDDDREKLRKAIELLFWEAKSKNRRKK